jgi:LacI family transcriptional regulator
MEQRSPQRLPQRLTAEFRQKIEQGEWPVGTRLPTTRELATTYRVSVNTIQSAFRGLEADNLVERRPGIGGYVKGRHSRPGALRRASTFAVIGPQAAIQAGDLAGDLWGYRIIRGLDAEVAPSGFPLTTFSYSISDEDKALPKLLEKIDQAGGTVAGVLCFVNDTIAGVLDELDRRNIPWVTVNRSKEHAAHNFVTHDAFRGGRLIGRCFARMGFDRVAILSVPLAMGRSGGDKYFGFQQGWIEAGMPTRGIDFVQCESGYDEVGHDNFLAYVEKYGPPRAVFTGGDFLALGAIRACRELGLAVPEQVAVVGSTGLDVAAYSHPSLTVLDTPMEQMGSNAGQMLLEMAREGVRRMTGRYVKANLTIRESCPIPADLLAQEEAAVDKTP